MDKKGEKLNGNTKRSAVMAVGMRFLTRGVYEGKEVRADPKNGHHVRHPCLRLTPPDALETSFSLFLDVKFVDT
jgi:hypothetical protein